MVSFWSTSTGLVIIGSKVYGGYTQPTDPLKSKRTGKSASNLKGKKYDSCVFEAIQPKLLSKALERSSLGWEKAGSGS
ncbi:hypothetical protein FG05_12055 [Fusarium graminearum]|nr:hypothetical protein FG05_12055 [Fusarium graminearum]